MVGDAVVVIASLGLGVACGDQLDVDLLQLGGNPILPNFGFLGGVTNHQ